MGWATDDDDNDNDDDDDDDDDNDDDDDHPLAYSLPIRGAVTALISELCGVREVHRR